MVRLKSFAAIFSFAVIAITGLQKPLYAAELEQAVVECTDVREHENTYEVYSAQQLEAALDGSCVDLSYRTMYDQGKIHITMKHVSSDDMGIYALSSNVIVAKEKEIILDMNGFDLYASGQDGQGNVNNPVILVPPSSSLSIQGGWIESSIRNISINNQGYLKLDRVDVVPAVGQAVYNTGVANVVSSDLYAGTNAVYAVINEGGTFTLDGEENAELATLSGIYNIGNSRGDACLQIKNGFYITGERAVVNNGGVVKIGALAEKNTSVIDGKETGILSVNGGRTDMFDGTVRGGVVAVSTSPVVLSTSVTGKTGGSFQMIGGTLSGNYGVAFQADSYVSLKAGRVTGSEAAVASVSYDGNLTENITSYQFYNTDNREADAYYYDASVKQNVLCNEIYNGKIVLAAEEVENEPIEEQEDESVEPISQMIEVTVGGQDIYWNEAYENSANEPEASEEVQDLKFPMPADLPDESECFPDASESPDTDFGESQGQEVRDTNQTEGNVGIRDGTNVRDGTCLSTGIRDGTIGLEEVNQSRKRSEIRIRDGTG